MCVEKERWSKTHLPLSLDKFTLIHLKKRKEKKKRESDFNQTIRLNRTSSYTLVSQDSRIFCQTAIWTSSQKTYNKVIPVKMFLIGTESTNYLDVDYWANVARFRSVSSFPHLICFPYITLMSCTMVTPYHKTVPPPSHLAFF